LEDQAVILFLDFDGVTHPEPYAPQAAFTQLSLIESVVRERVHVAIVVSSSWRESHSLDELRAFFAPDLQRRVVGVTPDLWDPALAPAYVRECECLAWLAANRPAGTRWLAIDDRPAFFQPNCPNLFLTDTLQGFLPGQMASLHDRLWERL
jgi:HAD domain in Swiss Army Knife RNA repair proteins